jgi:hypothetical protein
MKKIFTLDSALRYGLLCGLIGVAIYLAWHLHQYGWQYVITNP